MCRSQPARRHFSYRKWQASFLKARRGEKQIYHLRGVSIPGERIFVHGESAEGSRGRCPLPADARPSDGSGGTRSHKCCALGGPVPITVADAAGWRVRPRARHGQGASEEGEPWSAADRESGRGHQELGTAWGGGDAGRRVRVRV